MNIQVDENIQMRLLTATDADDAYNLVNCNKEYLRKWLHWVDNANSLEVVKNTIITWENQYQAGTDIVFGIFKGTTHIGIIGLHGLKSYNNSGMLGYWLSQSEQGNGIMTKCIKAFVNYAFETLSLNRVYIQCASENKKSQAIPIRLGFKKEGVLRDGECLYGKYFDLLIFGLLKREWII